VSGKKKVIIILSVCFPLCCCMAACISFSPFSALSYIGWHSEPGPFGTDIRIKDSWTLVDDDDDEVSWILDEDGEVLFRGIPYDGIIRHVGAEHVLRELPGYELVEETRMGSDDIRALSKMTCRDTATGEAVTIWMVEYYDVDHSRYRAVVFYSISDRVGWYDIHKMGELLFFIF
jgi:hypothetical protein